MQVYETAGESLRGAIDGTNLTYTTSLAFDVDSLNVYVNGLLKVLRPDFVDGADVVDASTIRMRTALLPGDTLAVSYAMAGQGALGGQLGGVPPTMDLSALAPSLLVVAQRAVPGSATLNVQSPPTTGLGALAPSMLVDGQREVPSAAGLSLQSPPL